MSAARQPVTIREVGPRDGLQAEAPIPIEARLRLIHALLDAGVRHIELASFVSEKAVPSMAGAAEVIATVGRLAGVTRYALVPNERGARAALEAGLDALTVTVAASEGYSQRNVRMSVADSAGIAATIAGLAHAEHTPIDVVVSCVFGSPYEGDVEPSAVAALCRRLRDGGADAITLADTTGMATPARVEAVLDAVGTGVGLHLHETRGTGLLNAWVALGAGVRLFDTSVGGLGGSPFAAGAAGNLATEDFVYVLEDNGFDTGIDLPGLLEASRVAAEVIGHAVPSRVAAAGPRLVHP